MLKAFNMFTAGMCASSVMSLIYGGGPLLLVAIGILLFIANLYLGWPVR